ncbi:NlpC/P60 family protein [Anaeromyxobacter soli]|uniref:NlpC/P60 family protein n=3 Tax=Anaeromyxobacter TaxID=161492 RepID=UPI001FAFBAA6|nr:NlpC/P60 family protein [Anaeromyxobacter sp. SG29]
MSGTPGRTARRAAKLLALTLASVLGAGCAARSAVAPPLDGASTSADRDPTPPPGEAPPEPPRRAPELGAEPEAAPDAGAEAAPERAAQPGADAALDAVRERIVAAARALLGRRFRGDCSAFVLRAYRAAGVGVRLGPGVSRSESLYRASRPVEAPRPGTLVFFHDSYDRDRDRRLDDRFTHVALVERVEGTTVFLLHRARTGVERARMDLSRPDDPASNDLLRARRRRDPRGTRYLTGELFTAFGELLQGDVTQMLQAGRVAETGARHPAAR